jgi:uncharacterized protein (TIGR02145 family)
MRYLITLLLAALTLNAVGQTNLNYNPDYDANGEIGVNDLLGFLSIFGNTWDPGDDIMGCTYPSAVEYNSSANVDDGSCTFLVDCAGVINGLSLLDDCGVCNGDNTSCAGCDGVANSGLVNDECGVCGGNGIPVGACDCDGNYLESDCNPFICGEDVLHEIDPLITIGFDGTENILSWSHNYSTVQIGDRCWFSENCRYLPIEYFDENFFFMDSWSSETEPMYYSLVDVYGNEELDEDDYGALYNWPAIMTGDLCPSGWHVSTDEDFTNLTNSLGGEAIAGYEMKTSSLWGNYAIGTNSSGFNGKPSGAGFTDFGMMQFDSYYNQNVAYFWTTTLGATGYPAVPFRAFTRKLDSYNHSPECPKNNNNSHDRAFSARCVRD